MLPLLKKRSLSNAVLEIRVTRPTEIGRVQRLKVTGAGSSRASCCA